MEQEFDELMQASEIPAAPAAVEKAEEYDGKGIALVTGAHAMHDTYSGFLPALLPLLIEKFSLTNTLAGVLSLVYTIPAVLQPVIGFLADRVNLRVLIVFAPAITGLIMTSVGIVPSYSLLVVLLLFAGLSSSSLHSVGPGVGSHFSGRRIGRGMSFWMIGGEFGYSFGRSWLQLPLGSSASPSAVIGDRRRADQPDALVRHARCGYPVGKREQSVDKAAFLSGAQSDAADGLAAGYPRFDGGDALHVFADLLALARRQPGICRGWDGYHGCRGRCGLLPGWQQSDSFGRRRTLLISILATGDDAALCTHAAGCKWYF